MLYDHRKDPKATEDGEDAFMNIMCWLFSIGAFALIAFFVRGNIENVFDPESWRLLWETVKTSFSRFTFNG